MLWQWKAAVYRQHDARNQWVHWQHAWRKGDTIPINNAQSAEKGNCAVGCSCAEQTQAVTLRCWRPLRLTERFGFWRITETGISTALVGDSNVAPALAWLMVTGSVSRSR